MENISMLQTAHQAKIQDQDIVISTTPLFKFYTQPTQKGKEDMSLWNPCLCNTESNWNLWKHTNYTCYGEITLCRAID